nr:protein kinase [Paenactinomyces guangxiensis]
MGQRYRIEEQLGSGGMGRVYKAVDQLLQRPVAVKVMNDSMQTDEGYVKRFMREAKSIAKLSHPHVVQVFDVGIENGIDYMVMEFIQGQTLKEMILKRAPFTVEETASIAAQILDGLAHAHDNDIIHRDIKPQNIMVSSDGRIKITDFGLSRLTTATSQLTQTGTLMGSVQYFSPEQALGKEISFQSDLYSLGIVLFEMATGTLPFQADENVALALKHVMEPAPHPQTVNPALPDAFSNIILKALAKQSEDRYQTAWEMKEAVLEAFQPVAASTVEQQTPPMNLTFQLPHERNTASPPSHSAPAVSNRYHLNLDTAQNPRPSKGKVKWRMAALFLSLAFLGIVTFMIYNGASADSAPSTDVIPSSTLGGGQNQQQPNSPDTGSMVSNDKEKDKKNQKDGDVLKDQDKIKEEVEDFMTEYHKRSVKALNQGDFSIVSDMLDPDGPHYSGQKEYLLDLHAKGTREKHIVTKVTQIESQGDNKYKIVTFEGFNIYFKDKDDKYKTFKTPYIIIKTEKGYKVHSIGKVQTLSSKPL